MKHQVAVVVGTRPEMIKLAPVVFSLRRSESISPILIFTGQHREMLAQTAAVFGLKPDIDLALMQPGQTLAELTARILTEVAKVFRSQKIAAVLVQGDTTTVLATTLAAFYERIPVGHVEAGLRTNDILTPWPEEMNRRVAAPISRWCFAPTELSRQNLRRENIAPERIFVTGNTVVDALLWVRQKLHLQGVTAQQIISRCQIPTSFGQNFISRPFKPWILITGHRRESFGQGFEQICSALSRLAQLNPEVGLLYPVHLNPNVQEPVRRILSGNPRIALIPPAGYEDFVWLMDHCHFILSDSGGVQEEAPSLGKPVLVMRSSTERPEGVAAETCKLVGTDPDIIVAEAQRLLTDQSEYQRRSGLKNPYGDGTAAPAITRILERDLAGNSHAEPS